MSTRIGDAMKTVAVLFAVATLAACTDRAPATDASAAPAPATTESPAPAPEPPAPSTMAPAPSSMPTPATTTTPGDTDAEASYLGRWTGVEGMYLVVASKPGGGVTLDMQWDLDHKGRFDGSVTAEGLRFMRDGVAETAVRTDGDATGLKYLAGKKDCLTVKPGEGYCRD
jgi:hypothetical protein